jgi:hypothetical protein
MSGITDDRLDLYRTESTLVRVVRDASEQNDVRGYVVAWDDDHVLIRKRNRNVVKLKRSYLYQPASEDRPAEWPIS